MAGAGVAGAFDPVGVVAGAFHYPGVGAVPAPGVEVAFGGDVGREIGE